MNEVYPLAVQAFMQGEIDLDIDVIHAQLVEGLDFAEADQWLETVEAFGVGDAVLVPIDEVDEDGMAWLNGTLTFAAVPDGSTVNAVIFYVATGDSATSRLLGYVDKRGDTVPLIIETNGGDISLSWSQLFKL